MEVIHKSNMEKNYYQMLGLEEGASLEEIKAAYRKYAIKFHPDKQNGDEFFKERFQEIQEAYEYLCQNYKDESDILSEGYQEEGATEPYTENATYIYLLKKKKRLNMITSGIVVVLIILWIWGTIHFRYEAEYSTEEYGAIKWWVTSILSGVMFCYVLPMLIMMFLFYSPLDKKIDFHLTQNKCTKENH